MINQSDEFGNYSTVDALSHTFLQIQRPAYICCILICALDIIACVAFLLLTKYPNKIGANFYIRCDMVWELLSSLAYAVSSFVHLYNSLVDHSELTTPWNCFVTFGWISYLSILTSDYSSAMISIDRFISLMWPFIYKKFEQNHHIIFGAIIGGLVTVFTCSLLFDDFENFKIIPICMPQLGAGYYLHTLFTYNYTMTTFIPIILYCSMAMYLIYEKHHLVSFDSNSNLVNLQNQMRDHVFRALIFNTFWRLLTNVIISTSTWLSINTLYRGSLMDVYFTPLYFTDGIGMFLSYSLFVKKFRSNLKSLIKRKVQVMPLNAIDIGGQAIGPNFYNLPGVNVR